MAAATIDLEEPTIGVGDRLRKSRLWCGIKSASRMADLLNEHLADRLDKPIRDSTVNAWEAGTNQPTRIRMEELVRVWVDICNEAGAEDGRATSMEFVYGLRTGSFSSLRLVPHPAGQGSFDDFLAALDVPRPDLATV